MKRISLLLVLIMLGFSPLIQAEQNCSALSDTMAINQCSEQNKQAAESTLNNSYAAAKKRIDLSYRTDADSARALQKALLEAQRGWLQYREKQCYAEAFLAEKGSATNTALTNDCITQLDKIRIEQLNATPYE